MDELDGYGTFNTRYEGVGHLIYLYPSDSIPIYFEVRQLTNGRLLLGCVSTEKPIRDKPHALDGHLVTGEPFTTMWGRGITEIYRSEGLVSKAHYLATMTRVRYTRDVQPDDHSIQFAVHNFIPGPNSDVSENKIELNVRGHKLTIIPVGNYRDQADRLLRYGGNLRTGWIRRMFTDESGEHRIVPSDLDDVVRGIIDAISLAIGTLVISPQQVTFDRTGERNDVEHYSSDAHPFSTFIPRNKWDTPVKETIEAWFTAPRPIRFQPRELSVWIRQHLDACSTELYLETRALCAATLLDVIAGRYSTIWSSQLPHQIAFKTKLNRLLKDVGITLPEPHLNRVIKARNSL